MKKFLNWLKHNLLLLLAILVLISVSILVTRVIDLTKENKSLKKNIETLTIEKDKNFDLSTRNLQKVMYYPQLVEIDWMELCIGSKCL